MKHHGLHTKLGCRTNCKWVKIFIEKIILSDSHQALSYVSSNQGLQSGIIYEM